MKHTMENEFRNGLIGHRVEVKVGSESPLQILTIIDKVNQWEIGENPDGCKFAVQSDVYVVMDEAGVVDMIAPHTIGRVIRPQGEAPKPAEPYDLNNIDHLSRIECLLKESGFEVDTFPPYAYMYAIKQGHTVHIDTDGVCLTNKGVRMSPHIPLNEWVKNPTIESLKPKD